MNHPEVTSSDNTRRRDLSPPRGFALENDLDALLSKMQQHLRKPGLTEKGQNTQEKLLYEVELVVNLVKQVLKAYWHVAGTIQGDWESRGTLIHDPRDTIQLAHLQLNKVVKSLEQWGPVEDFPDDTNIPALYALISGFYTLQHTSSVAKGKPELFDTPQVLLASLGEICGVWNIIDFICLGKKYAGNRELNEEMMKSGLKSINWILGELQGDMDLFSRGENLSWLEGNAKCLDEQLSDCEKLVSYLDKNLAAIPQQHGGTPAPAGVSFTAT